MFGSSSQSRREFLTSATLAVAGGSLAARGLRALPVRTVAALPAAALLPEAMAHDVLRGLASAALDAARAAGASYADIRISDRAYLGVSETPGRQYPPGFGASRNFGFGIRAVVNGGSAFVYARTPTVDAVTRAARHATESARGIGKALALSSEWVPVPAVTGVWNAPMEIDPFTVPLREQWDVLGGYMAMAERVKYATANRTGISIGWSDETRVFASTEGGMLTQRFHRASFNVDISAKWTGGFGFDLGGPLRATGGFERAIDPALHGHIIRRAQEAVRLASFPATTMDVGRYDVVMTGAAMSGLVGQLLTPALELDRALGHEAGASGTSYLTPPLEMLGQQVLSPLLTLTSERDVNALEYAKWDDEGVECVPARVVDRGRIVDYFSSRATTEALRRWYERRGVPVRPNGNTVAGEAHWVPTPHPGHVTVQHAERTATVDDLCQGITKGLLVYNCFVSADQQLSSLFAPVTAFQITNGRITHQVGRVAIQGSTKRFWTRSLKAMGDASTVEHGSSITFKSQPTQYVRGTVTAPAARFADVDVIQLGF